MTFTTDYNNIIEQVKAIDPLAYGKTRNFIDGAVTKLSPYISRGVISTQKIFSSVLDRGFDPYHIEKFIQELAWRDYWQQVWIDKKEHINEDLRHPQPDVSNQQMPSALLTKRTMIEAIDDGLNDLFETGYLHNHLRMYTASIASNMAKSHWRVPARWMYYHLLDGDWASNALSWQWVAGANANKKYVANQENINKFCYTDQRQTWLDVPYESFDEWQVPEVLEELSTPDLHTTLPESTLTTLDIEKPTLLYNWYNLDPNWHSNEDANRVLLVEPEVFKKYPISEKSMDFMLDLSKNIAGIQIFVGSQAELKELYDVTNFIYKEHPLNEYEGKEEPRDWMFSVKGYHKSFFAFWKKCRKELH